MNKKNQFIQFALNALKFGSKQDLIEGLYLEALIDSYNRIEKNVGIENDIRDRFIFDLYHHNQFTKDLLQQNILYVNWERWVFKNEDDLGRADLTFSISGLDFIVECKRLKNISSLYITEGLNRFINDEYADNEEYASMLGFVINNNTEKILNGLFTKCKSTSFINNEFSQQRYSKWTHSFKTSHVRVSSNNINIYHLFFEFSLS